MTTEQKRSFAILQYQLQHPTAPGLNLTPAVPTIANTPVSAPTAPKDAPFFDRLKTGLFNFIEHFLLGAVAGGIGASVEHMALATSGHARCTSGQPS